MSFIEQFNQIRYKAPSIRNLIVFYLLVLPFGLFAQQTTPLINSTLDGLVVDAVTNAPLLGASVQIEGVTHVTTTDDEGKFRFVTGQKFPYTLIVTYVGYKTTTVVADGSPITIELARLDDSLDEVEVVGYTRIKRSSLTSSIQVVKGEDLSQAPVTSIVEKLQGQVPGLLISSDSGVPGTSLFVRLRGANSINAGNDPLYVVDDVIVNSDNLQGLNLGGQLVNPLSDINPQDVESVTVLKDANATSIYGARGANGVILIKTNRGNNSRVRVNLNTETGIARTRNLWETVTGPEHAEIVNQVWINDGKAYENRPFRSVEDARPGFPAYGNPGDLGTYNRVDDVFRTGVLQRYSLSASGGNASTNFYVGGELLNQESTLKLQDFNRYSFRLNLDNNVSRFLKIGTSNNLSSVPRQIVRVGDGPVGLFQAALHTPTYFPVFDENGLFTRPANFDNHIAILENSDSHSLSLRTVNNVYGMLSILPNLTFKSSWSNDYNVYREKAYFNTNLNPGQPAGSANDITTTRQTLTGDQILNYNLSKEGGDLALLLGNTFQYTAGERQSLTGTRFPSNEHRRIASAGAVAGTTTGTTSAVLSFFGGANYAYKDRYVIDGTFRADGSSRIGKDHRWGYFPAVGFNWNVSNEQFFPKSDDFSELRFKASWGIAGNASVGDFESLGLWGGGRNYGTNPGIAPSQIPNPDLKWETTRQWNFGVSGLLFKGKLDFELNYYTKHTYDLLLDDPIPDISGFSSVTRNAGEISNKGVELFLNSENISKKDFRWRTTFTISHNKNKVERLLRPITGGYAMFRMEQGHPLHSIYVYDYLGVNPENGDAIYRDFNGDGRITTADRQILGDPWPDFEGAFRNVFAYKGIDLNVNVYYRYGNQIFNYTAMFINAGGKRGITRSIAKEAMNYWRNPGDTDVLPRPTTVRNADGGLNYDNYISYYLEDASFIRLKDITVGYQLPRKIATKLRLTNARATLTASNLFVITNYSGPDPEANSQANSYLVQGLDFNTTPQPLTFTLGLNVTL